MQAPPKYSATGPLKLPLRVRDPCSWFMLRLPGDAFHLQYAGPDQLRNFPQNIPGIISCPRYADLQDRDLKNILLLGKMEFKMEYDDLRSQQSVNPNKLVKFKMLPKFWRIGE